MNFYAKLIFENLKFSQKSSFHSFYMYPYKHDKIFELIQIFSSLTWGQNGFRFILFYLIHRTSGTQIVFILLHL